VAAGASTAFHSKLSRPARVGEGAGEGVAFF